MHFDLRSPTPADKCVDDMHVVTEREWQALMKRLDDLEWKTDPTGHMTGKEK
jgi:tetrahydromethanopterin S-methyltransferase subunit G